MVNLRPWRKSKKLSKSGGVSGSVTSLTLSASQERNSSPTRANSIDYSHSSSDTYSIDDSPARDELLEGNISLTVTIGHLKRIVTVSVARRMQIYDVLVMIATKHGLKPSDYSLQTSTDSNRIKASTPIGLVNVDRMVIVPKNRSLYNSTECLPNSDNLPFELRFKYEVHLPHNQLTCIRCPVSFRLEQLYDQVCDDKQLKKDRYVLVKPFKDGESPVRLDLDMKLVDLQPKAIKLLTEAEFANLQKEFRIDEFCYKSTPNVTEKNLFEQTKLNGTLTRSVSSVHTDTSATGRRYRKKRAAPPPPPIQEAKSLQNLNKISSEDVATLSPSPVSEGFGSMNTTGSDDSKPVCPKPTLVLRRPDSESSGYDDSMSPKCVTPTLPGEVECKELVSGDGSNPDKAVPIPSVRKSVSIKKCRAPPPPPPSPKVVLETKPGVRPESPEFSSDDLSNSLHSDAASSTSSTFMEESHLASLNNQSLSPITIIQRSSSAPSNDCYYQPVWPKDDATEVVPTVVESPLSPPPPSPTLPVEPAKIEENIEQRSSPVDGSSPESESVKEESPVEFTTESSLESSPQPAKVESSSLLDCKPTIVKSSSEPESRSEVPVESTPIVVESSEPVGTTICASGASIDESSDEMSKPVVVLSQWGSSASVAKLNGHHDSKPLADRSLDKQCEVTLNELTESLDRSLECSESGEQRLPKSNHVMGESKSGDTCTGHSLCPPQANSLSSSSSFSVRDHIRKFNTVSESNLRSQLNISLSSLNSASATLKRVNSRNDPDGGDDQSPNVHRRLPNFRIGSFKKNLNIYDSGDDQSSSTVRKTSPVAGEKVVANGQSPKMAKQQSVPNGSAGKQLQPSISFMEELRSRCSQAEVWAEGPKSQPEVKIPTLTSVRPTLARQDHIVPSDSNNNLHSAVNKNQVAKVPNGTIPPPPPPPPPPPTFTPIERSVSVDISACKSHLFSAKPYAKPSTKQTTVRSPSNHHQHRQSPEMNVTNDRNAFLNEIVNFQKQNKLKKVAVNEQFRLEKKST